MLERNERHWKEVIERINFRDFLRTKTGVMIFRLTGSDNTESIKNGKTK